MTRRKLDVATEVESNTIVTVERQSPGFARISSELDSTSAPSNEGTEHSADPTTLAEAVEVLERRMIQDALRRNSGNIARSAKELGLSRKGLYMKIERLNSDI